MFLLPSSTLSPGPPGDDGLVADTTLQCPPGEFMTGFSVTGGVADISCEGAIPPPSSAPTTSPTATPTTAPTATPSAAPTASPSASPTTAPSSAGGGGSCPPPSQQVYYLAAVGQTCTDACATTGLSCQDGTDGTDGWTFPFAYNIGVSGAAPSDSGPAFTNVYANMGTPGFTCPSYAGLSGADGPGIVASSGACGSKTYLNSVALTSRTLCGASPRSDLQRLCCCASDALHCKSVAEGLC